MRSASRLGVGLGLAAGLWLGGCATAPESAPSSAGPGASAAQTDVAAGPSAVDDADLERERKKNELICTREKPIGSHVMRRVCRTREQIEREREAAQEARRRAQGLPGPSPVSGP